MKKLFVFLPIIFLIQIFTPGRTGKDYELTGVVMDETGTPVIGASVVLKGTKIGTLTNINGQFTLSSHDSCATVQVIYVGYQSQEQQVCSGVPVNITMNQPTTLDEVVIVSEERKPAAKKDKAKENRMMNQVLSAPSMSAMGSITPYYNGDDQPGFNTEDYDVINENRFFEVVQQPVSTFSIDVDAASYSNMRRFINNGQLPPKDAVRIEEMVNYFTYDYPEPKNEHPFTVTTEIGECPWQPKHKLVHIGLQGRHIPTENLPPSNIVFLIDVSGSMEMANKLPLLQSSFKLLADQLRAKDKVAIVVYAGAAGVVLPATAGADKTKIKEAIDQLQAGGSTAGGAGIKLAYKIAGENFVKGGNNRVILATDGDFNVGASSDGELVRMIEKERESGVFLTVLGFGMGNYKDNKMQQLADAGNGNHAYIDNISEAKKVLVSEFGGTLFTIAKDVKLQLEFNPSKVRGYRLIGYENRMLNREDFNDDKKDAGELGSGHTVTALYEIIPVGVESPFLANVDDLKYQQTTTKTPAQNTNEWLTIKLRYKQPDGNKSQLLEQAVSDRDEKLSETSENFRWSAAVAEFGMLLRDSEFKGNATFEKTRRLAEGAKGKDTEGYRTECIRLMQMAGDMKGPIEADNKN